MRIRERAHEYYSLCSLNINGFHCRRRQTRIISVLCFRIDTDRYNNNITIGVSGVDGTTTSHVYSALAAAVLKVPILYIIL